MFHTLLKLGGYYSSGRHESAYGKSLDNTLEDFGYNLIFRLKNE